MNDETITITSDTDALDAALDSAAALLTRTFKNISYISGLRQQRRKLIPGDAQKTALSQADRERHAEASQLHSEISMLQRHLPDLAATLVRSLQTLEEANIGKTPTVVLLAQYLPKAAD
jgi:hypothetical protein